jgi:uncharacterized membrane protein
MRATALLLLLLPLAQAFTFHAPTSLSPPPSTTLLSSTKAKQTSSFRPAVKTAAVTTLAAVSFPAPALASTGAVAVAKTHLGERVAAKISSTFPSLSPTQILCLISAMPVLELRGAIPVGAWLGIPMSTVFPVAVIGNMIPIIPLLLILKSKPIQQIFSPLLTRASHKLGNVQPSQKWSALALFVGIPLPGTGAWTGAMAAFALGMGFSESLSAIFVGVVSAGAIMSSLTLAGKKGGVLALAVLAWFCYNAAMGDGGD